jgi:hypothetical protein
MFTLMSLFKVCAEQNYHSRCFKKTHTISLKKSNKSNYTNFKTYRFIAFFNILDKTLKSIIVRRISISQRRTSCFSRHKWVSVEKEHAKRRWSFSRSKFTLYEIWARIKWQLCWIWTWSTHMITCRKIDWFIIYAKDAFRIE